MSYGYLLSRRLFINSGGYAITDLYDEITMSNNKNDDRYDEFTQFDTLQQYGERRLRNEIKIARPKPISEKPLNTKPPAKKSSSILSGFKEFFMNAATSTNVVDDHVSSEGVWVGWQEKATVHDRSIDGGFFYLAESHSGAFGQDNPSEVVLDKDAAISQSLPYALDCYKDDSLSYWPSYSKLSVRCRGVYLDWLASSRNNTQIPLGYVFIYFSGLEYRVINEHKSINDDEFITIYKEVVRLYNTYGSNYSFANFSANFASYMRALRPELIKSYDSNRIQETSGIINKAESGVELQISKKIRDDEPITPSLALAWVKRSTQFSTTTVHKRMESEFEFLFTDSFNKEFPNGLILKNNGSSLSRVYDPSNYAITKTSFPFSALPNPQTYTIPFRKLIGIAERSSAALAAASRYLGKNDNNHKSLDFIALLPQPLIAHKAANNDTMMDGLKDWAYRVVARDGGLTTTTELWAKIKSPLINNSETAAADDKSFQKDSRAMSVLLEALGYGVAPDKRYHDEDMNRFESIVLFKSWHEDDIFVGPSYYDAKSIIALACVIAKTNDDTPNETDNLTQIDVFGTAAAIMACIDKHLDITEYEMSSLSAYALWRLTNNNSKVQLKPKKDHFRSVTSLEAANLIIEAAFSDTNFNKHRINKAQKVFVYLGGSKGGLPSIIHRLQTSGSIAGEEPSGGAALDFDKLKQYENETKNSAQMLNTVFSDDSETSIEPVVNSDKAATMTPIETPKQTDTAVLNEAQDDGLDSAHRQLYQTLIQKEVWSRDEVAEMCKALNLMLSGAIETINDWSFDRIDEAVIEEDSEITVDIESVEELNKLN